MSKCHLAKRLQWQFKFYKIAEQSDDCRNIASSFCKEEEGAEKDDWELLLDIRCSKNIVMFSKSCNDRNSFD